MGAPPVSTVLQCTGCGAAVAFAGPALSTTCSYCDSPMVDEVRATGSVDGVVPFRIPRRRAVELLRAHLAGRWWAPASLRGLRVHERALRGVLVPFWAYEGVVRSEYRAKIGLYWYRSETYTDAEGKQRTRRVRETEWRRLRGTAARRIEDHVVSASLGLPELEASTLAPFDLGWVTSYDPRLLSGFEAELPTLAELDAEQTALAQLREAEARRISAELLPGDVNRLDRISSEVELASPRLVLLPVWISVQRRGELILRLLVNGQTGQVSGRLPISRAKLAALVLVAVLGVAVIALLVWLGGRPPA